MQPKLREATLRALKQAEDALRLAQAAVVEARKLVDDAWTEDTPRPRTAWCPVRPDDKSPLEGLLKTESVPLTPEQKEDIRKKAERIAKRWAPKKPAPFNPRGRNR